MKKAIFAFAGVTAAGLVAAYVGRDLYISQTGYEAARIAAQLCPGRFLAYEDGTKSLSTPMLYCSNSRPTPQKGNAVDPAATFTLASMHDLCPSGGTLSDEGGALACVDRSGKCPKRGDLPKMTEDGKIECKNFLELQ